MHFAGWQHHKIGDNLSHNSPQRFLNPWLDIEIASGKKRKRKEKRRRKKKRLEKLL